jgi:aerobic carbon-monoxide dehydrogenase small subunit
LIDGEPIMSCLYLGVEGVGKEITTVEGLAERSEPSVLQKAFARSGGAQCGYCTPGFLMSGTALLERNKEPTEKEIREALSGNLCRCTGYTKIIEAVQIAAEEVRSSEESRRAG